MLFSTNLVAHAANPTSPASAASTFSFNPVADAYVIQSSPDINYGANVSLRVDNSPLTASYLRFVVSGLNGSPIQSAKLRIYANSANTAGYAVNLVSDNSWAENGLTFNNAPAAGASLGNSQPLVGAAWAEVDLSSYVTAEGSYSLELTTTNATNTNLAARESGANAPQLVITAAAPETATATSLPTEPAVATATGVPTLVPTEPATATNVPTQVPTLPATATATIAPTLVPTNTAAATAVPATATSTTAANWQPTFPIRAAFYYPWFAEAWTQSGIFPYTNYTPSLGHYSSADPSIIKKHIDMMQYAHIQAGISSWWGQGHHTDTKFAGLLAAAAGTNFRWALYYENESQLDPSVSQIQSDLTYIRNHYGNDPSFLRVNGKFVVFVYAAPNDGCGMADRWKQANTVGAYVMLKVFPGFSACASQPDGWHQYSPAVAADQQGTTSYAISPGFWLKGQPVRLARDINRWTQNVKDMVASGANWQLVTTFSEWGEGTAVEPAAEWSSASGYGQYLDVLHNNGASTSPTQTSVPQPTFTPTVFPTSIPATNTPVITTATGSPSQNLSFTPLADDYVSADVPASNYGAAVALRADASPVVKSYLRFNVAGLNGRTVSQARLMIYANSASTQGLTVQAVADNTWAEMTLSSGNAPVLGVSLASAANVVSGTWVTLDVTSYVRADGTFSFGLTTPGSTGISLAARESGANAPKLVISTGGTTNPTATPSATPVKTKTPTPVVGPTKTPTAVKTNTPTAVASPTNTPVTGGDPVLVGAGDISSCANNGDESTAKLIDAIPGTVFTAGDDAYESGTPAEFTNCYNPTWGRFKSRTKPAPGNHEYKTAGGAGYYGYFGAAAGDPTKGYYSYNLGTWHIVVLNGEISTAAGSAQEKWLRQDLATNPTACTLAYWHEPLFSSSSSHGNTPGVQPLWQALYDYHAEVVVNGHDHLYERFAPQSPTGVADPKGLREFVAGMGGRSHYAFGTIQPNSVARNSDTYGVIKFTLHANSYDWQFVPEAGKTFADSGTAQCTP
jgi:hypothetical protein